jgi:hypothetical protein
MIERDWRERTEIETWDRDNDNTVSTCLGRTWLIAYLVCHSFGPAQDKSEAENRPKNLN